MTPIVWHCDADAFFAACHLARDRSLRGRPVVVGGDPSTRHGIVLTASYEARAFGVRTAMPLYEAYRRCRDLVVVAPDRALYEACHEGLKRIWDAFSPVVEGCSIDEAWLDMGGGVLRSWGGDPVAAAHDLQERVANELGISVSIGIAPNKMLAKQASDMQKPGGVTVLELEDVPWRLWPLPARALYGIGPKGAEKLSAAGIKTVGEVATAEREWVESILGRHAGRLQERARGLDDAPVTVPVAGGEQSLSVERTLPRDVRTLEDASPDLLALADALAARLRRHQRWGYTIVLKYKTTAFQLHSRQVTLPSPTQDRDRLYRAALALFRDRPHPDPVRLLGLGASRLVRAPADLFEGQTANQLATAVDSIRERYGGDAIGPLASRGRLGAVASAFARPSLEEAPQ